MFLLVTPPLTQLNTPYPATTQLKAFLQANGLKARQADIGIELANKVFSSQFLSSIIPTGLADADRYLATIDPVMRFLRGEDTSLATRIASRAFLPEGRQFRSIGDMEWSFGLSGTDDMARHIATLYLEDVAQIIKDFADPHFEMVRYAESICSYADTFDEIESMLHTPPSKVESLMTSILDNHIGDDTRIVALSVPFPGCLIPALRCGQHIKENHPDITVCMGGGFPNTEWRNLSDARLFKYTDFVTLDDGELPLTRIALHLQGKLEREQLLRTYCIQNDEVAYINNRDCGMPVQVANNSLPAPDFEGLPFGLYLSLADTTNPMQRLWTCGRWNKLMMAHGCYWAKCAFCDTTLDYIGRYDAPEASTVVDRMEHIANQTGCSGFHFVDEAMPPKLLGEVCREILRRRLTFSFWGNIRFERSYDKELCQLMADAGCIAVSGGLEVASDRLLRLIGKGVSVQQTVQTARHFRDAGIMVHTYLMYGFPTETLSETIEALDNVRLMFADGIVQSAFWHRYAMTVHSPSGKEPSKYGATHIGNPGCNPFCNNEIPFHYDFNYDLDAVGPILRTATYNYMNGLALERPAKSWFKKMRK